VGWLFRVARACKTIENYYSRRMAKKVSGAKSSVVGRKSLEPKFTPGSTESRPTAKNPLATSEVGSSRCDDRTPERGVPTKPQKPSSLLDTRVVYCGDNLEQLAKLPDACVDLIYIDPPFNSSPYVN
jgi:hypothetical protein